MILNKVNTSLGGLTFEFTHEATQAAYWTVNDNAHEKVFVRSFSLNAACLKCKFASCEVLK